MLTEERVLRKEFDELDATPRGRLLRQSQWRLVVTDLLLLLDALRGDALAAASERPVLR